MNGLWSSLEPAPTRELDRALHGFEALAKRAIAGALIYVMIVVGWGLTQHDHVGPAVAALAVLGALRLTFLRRGRGLMTTRPRVWRRTFWMLALSSVLAFEGFVAHTAQARQLDPLSIALVAASCGVLVGASYSLSPDRWLANVFTLVARAPILVVLAMMNTRLSAFVFALLALQTLYCLILGKQLNREFWSARTTVETLAQAHEDLRRAAEDREREQAKLRLAQKLEAIGRLAAGVAHEINTPLQAAMLSLETIREGIGAAVTTWHGQPPTSEDETFFTAELPVAIEVVDESLRRTAAIVRSIKELSHPGARDKEPADLRRVMTSVLSLAKHEYTGIADVELDFDELPIVHCHASELGQAFLNILVNAAQALAEAPRRQPGRIRVRMRNVTDHVKIEISDNGPGIPVHVRSAIFDPFVTTKQVGTGTGQGLAIARSIVVNRHAGEIEFTSSDAGTTFRLSIPVDAPLVAAA